MTPGEQLRAYREASGLSHEDVALGFETTPVAISARSRAEWLALIEAGVAEITGEDLGALLVLISDVADAIGVRPAPAGRAAA